MKMNKRDTEQPKCCDIDSHPKICIMYKKEWKLFFTDMSQHKLFNCFFLLLAKSLLAFCLLPLYPFFCFSHFCWWCLIMWCHPHHPHKKKYKNIYVRMCSICWNKRQKYMQWESCGENCCLGCCCLLLIDMT